MNAVLYQLGRVRAPEEPLLDGAWLWFMIAERPAVPCERSDADSSPVPLATSIIAEAEDEGVWVSSAYVELHCAFATDREVEVVLRDQGEFERYMAAARRGRTVGERRLGEPLPWEVHGKADPNPELN